MSKTLNIRDKATVSKRLWNFLSEGMMWASIGYLSWTFITKPAEMQETYDTQMVAEAIVDAHYKRAAYLIDHFELQESWGKKDLTSVFPTIPLANLVRVAIEQKDTDATTRYMEKLRTDDTLTTDQFRGLEATVGIESEQILFKLAMQDTGRSAIALSERYLSLHPLGERRNEIIVNQIYAYFDLIENATSDNPHNWLTYENIVELNQKLGQYTHIIESLDPDRVEKVQQQLAEMYENRNSVQIGSNRPVRGNLVKVIGSSGSNWVSPYLIDRDRNFPVGTIGKVFNRYDKEKVYVEFDSVEDISWSRAWDDPNTGRYPNIGSYVEDELQAYVRLSELPMGMAAIKRAESLLSGNE